MIIILQVDWNLRIKDNDSMILEMVMMQVNDAFIITV